MHGDIVTTHVVPPPRHFPRWQAAAVALLLELGADPSAMDRWGASPVLSRYGGRYPAFLDASMEWGVKCYDPNPEASDNLILSADHPKYD